MQHSPTLLKLPIILVPVIVTLSPAQWERLNGPPTEVTYSLAAATTSAGDTVIIAGSHAGYVYRTDDYGDTWHRIDRSPSPDTGFTQLTIQALLAVPNGQSGIRAFAATPGRGVFVSHKADTNWQTINNGLTSLVVWDLVARDTTIYAYTNHGVFASSNNGADWSPSPVTEIIGSREFVATWNANGDTTLFKDWGSGLIRSTDHGGTWIQSNSGLNSNHNFKCLVSRDSLVYMGTSMGVYFSYNQGITWVFGGPRFVEALVIAGPYLFLGSGEVGVLRSVWRRPLSQMLTAVHDIGRDFPEISSLEQNYPNPFNSTTTLRFTLNQNTDYTITVADILGRELWHQAGRTDQPKTIQVRWDGRDDRGVSLSTGVYFATLRADNLIQSRRMVLLR